MDRKLLTYTSAPLTQATTVTGLGQVTPDVTGVLGAQNGALYAYLEDMQPNGRVTYQIGHGGTSPSFVELPVVQ